MRLTEMINGATPTGTSKPLCILLLEDDADYAALVLRWLSADPRQAEFALSWTDTLGAALARLEQGGVQLILADLGLPDSEGLATFSALRGKAPDLPIVILSGGDDEGLALQTIENGAQDYLIKFSCTAELLIRTIRHTVVRHGLGRTPEISPKQEPTSRIAAVLGASGGVGTTIVASVLAAEIRHQTEQPTLLADLDLSPGMVAFTTGIDPHYSVHDAVEMVDRLDDSLWESLVTERAGNLDILASTHDKACTGLDAGRVVELLRFARQRYPWTVLDLGRLNPVSKELLSSIDEVVLVSGPLVPALHQCKHALEILSGAGIERERIRLILNRREKTRRLSPKEIQNLFGIRIDSTLPAAHDDLYTACLQKRLPAVNSEFRTELAVLARKIAGLDNAGPKRPLLSLTSFADRFRSIAEPAAKPEAR